MKGFLGKKYGPLPAWAWLAIALAAVGGYIVYKRRKAAAQDTSQSATGSSDTTGYVPTTGTTGASGDGGSAAQSGYPNGAGDTDFTAALSGLQADLEALTQAIEDQTGTGGSTPGTTTVPTPTTTAAVVPTPGSTTGGVTPVTTVHSTTPATTKTGTSTATPKALPKTAATLAPKAVTITANKTGGSANLKQGVFAIH